MSTQRHANFQFAREHVLGKQVAWASNRGLQLIGSRGARGRAVYTTDTSSNLFQPLNEDTRIDLNNGDGGELNGDDERPAKMCALHSSSALGVNVFDYWREQADLSPLLSACKLIRSGASVPGEVRFEQQFPIDGRFRYAPNIDVVITRATGPCAIECKFTEAYSPRSHGGLDLKYLDSPGVWGNLRATRKLAVSISPSDSRFEFLHAAQLIKHTLGLNRQYGHGRYRLLYLWYDALGRPGYQHREEVNDFAEVLKKDGVDFRTLTYQELILNLARVREDHPAYVDYLTGRYL